MKSFLKRGLATLVVIVLIVIGIAIDNRTIDVYEREIYSQKFSTDFDGYKIVFLSDYHNAYYYEQTIEKVKQQVPSIILLGGDMITIGNPDRSNTTALIKGLVNIAPVYFVTGNHESMNGDGSVLVSELINMGVTVITNKNSPITINSDGTTVESNSVMKSTSTKKNTDIQDAIYLHAIPDYSCLDDSALDLMDDYFESVLEQKEEDVVDGGFNILLMHRANLFDYVDDFGFDLVLAGHIHGGVLRLPYFGGVFSTVRGEFFPKYTAGLYYGEKSRMIVSRGMDYDFNKPRFFNGPEIVSLTLRRKN